MRSDVVNISTALWCHEDAESIKEMLEIAARLLIKTTHTNEDRHIIESPLTQIRLQ